jgi:ring-1,2-phenylacetyl-CoA epoxidase subunit PaaD
MTPRTKPTRDDLFAILETVKDPEVPVLSVVELGVARDARIDGDEVVVTITPTYSGCPAMQTIEDDIRAAFRREGLESVRVETVFNPPWTTDWIGPAARGKLEAYGIAPPGPAPRGDDDLVPLLRRSDSVRCPYCGAARTELRSEFGSTACKSIRFCASCQQPFEQFKAI